MNKVIASIVRRSSPTMEAIIEGSRPETLVRAEREEAMVNSYPFTLNTIRSIRQ